MSGNDSSSHPQNQYFQKIIDTYTGIEINKRYNNRNNEGNSLTIDETKDDFENYKLILNTFMLPFVEFELKMNQFDDGKNNNLFKKNNGKDPVIFHVDPNETSRNFIIQTIQKFGGVCSTTFSNNYINLSSSKVNWIHPIHIFLSINENKVLHLEVAKIYKLNYYFELNVKVIINYKYWLSKSKMYGDVALKEDDDEVNEVLNRECTNNFLVMENLEFIDLIRKRNPILQKFRLDQIQRQISGHTIGNLMKNKNLDKNTNESNLQQLTHKGLAYNYHEHYLLATLAHIYLVFHSNVQLMSEQVLLNEFTKTSSVAIFFVRLLPNRRELNGIRLKIVSAFNIIETTRNYIKAIESSRDEVQMLKLNEIYSRSFDKMDQTASFEQIKPTIQLSYNNMLKLVDFFANKSLEEAYRDLANEIGVSRDDLKLLKAEFDASISPSLGERQIKNYRYDRSGIKFFLLGKLIEKEISDLGFNKEKANDITLSKTFFQMAVALLEGHREKPVSWNSYRQHVGHNGLPKFLEFIDVFAAHADEQKIISFLEFKDNDQDIFSQDQFFKLKYTCLLIIFKLSNFNRSDVFKEFSKIWNIREEKVSIRFHSFLAEFLINGRVNSDRQKDLENYLVFNRTNGSLVTKILAVFPGTGNNFDFENYEPVVSDAMIYHHVEVRTRVSAEVDPDQVVSRRTKSKRK
ncbi:uncharacterized protein KGF55_004756 [Candida pseudojiufengensis]|uniref:uncharacterized protein n=1 Tax=Candida pseudojiufengensis TaxID=497109 RepID=UPI002224AC9E|nr:uncharacterized protein KGF55_004756 [Candida pseudojiufengensis]KAI5960463.1 hypothetical protein KGF55_004756 [Candida pseudojiufengensis]